MAPANINFDEQKILDYLADPEQVLDPLAELEASIYTTILTRRYAGSRERVTRIVKFFNPASSPSQIDAALSILVNRKLLSETDAGIGLPPRWDVTLASALRPRGPVPNDILERVSLSQRSHEEELLEKVGWARSPEASQKMRALIGRASHRIRIGCFSASVLYDDIADAIKAAATRNKSLAVQILMFSPELAHRIEHDHNVKEDVTKGATLWHALFLKAFAEAAKDGMAPTFEISWLGEEQSDFTGVHRAVFVDDRYWMLNIHRIGFDRGIDGLVYHGSSQPNAPTTIYRALDHYWESAWKAAILKHRVPDKPLAPHRGVS